MYDEPEKILFWQSKDVETRKCLGRSGEYYAKLNFLQKFVC